MSPGSALCSQLLEVTGHPGHPPVVHFRTQGVIWESWLCQGCWNKVWPQQTCPHCSSTDQTRPLAPLHPMPLSTCCAENIDLWLHRPFLLPLFFLPADLDFDQLPLYRNYPWQAKRPIKVSFFTAFARKPEGLCHPCRGTRSSRRKGEDELLVQGKAVLWWLYTRDFILFLPSDSCRTEMICPCPGQGAGTHWFVTGLRLRRSFHVWHPPCWTAGGSCWYLDLSTESSQSYMKQNTNSKVKS